MFWTVLAIYLYIAASLIIGILAWRAMDYEPFFARAACQAAIFWPLLPLLIIVVVIAYLVFILCCRYL